jgi:hypothetical protein
MSGGCVGWPAVLAGPPSSFPGSNRKICAPRCEKTSLGLSHGHGPITWRATASIRRPLRLPKGRNGQIATPLHSYLLHCLACHVQCRRRIPRSTPWPRSSTLASSTAPRAVRASTFVTPSFSVTVHFSAVSAAPTTAATGATTAGARDASRPSNPEPSSTATAGRGQSAPHALMLRCIRHRLSTCASSAVSPSRLSAVTQNTAPADAGSPLTGRPRLATKLASGPRTYE